MSADSERGVGRPTDYRPEYADLAFKFCLLGADDTDLARMFDVDISTIYDWKQQHTDFTDALRAGKDEADANVADRLYQRALGYSHPDVDIKSYEGEIIQTPIIKHYPPDPASMIFWLKNRQRGKWRDKIEQEVSGPNGQPLTTQVVVYLPSNNRDDPPKET